MFLTSFAKVCSFGEKSSTGDDTEEYEFQGPNILNEEIARLASESILQRISTFQRPVVVDRFEAAVNPAAVQRDPQSKTTAVTPTRLTTLRYVAPQRREGIEWTDSRKLLEAAIAVEQQFPSIGSDPSFMYREDVAAQEGRLVSRLGSLGLDMSVQLGDGNCQFRSLSFGLYGTPQHHAFVRKTVVDHMQLQRQEFEAFLGGDFKTYVRSMARNGVWGDELTLRAASEALGVVVNVITSDAENWFLRRPRGAASIRRSLSSLGRRNSRILAALDQYEHMRAVPETPQDLVLS